MAKDAAYAERVLEAKEHVASTRVDRKQFDTKGGNQWREAWRNGPQADGHRQSAWRADPRLQAFGSLGYKIHSAFPDKVAKFSSKHSSVCVSSFFRGRALVPFCLETTARRALGRLPVKPWCTRMRTLCFKVKQFPLLPVLDEQRLEQSRAKIQPHSS